MSKRGYTLDIKHVLPRGGWWRGFVLDDGRRGTVTVTRGAIKQMNHGYVNHHWFAKVVCENVTYYDGGCSSRPSMKELIDHVGTGSTHEDDDSMTFADKRARLVSQLTGLCRYAKRHNLDFGGAVLSAQQRCETQTQEICDEDE